MDDDMKSLRKKSSRHVLVIEADMSEDEKRRIFNIADRLRLAGNELTALMRNSIIQPELYYINYVDYKPSV